MTKAFGLHFKAGLACAAILGGAVLAAPPAALAQDSQGFRTPSGNINCMADAGELRCDLRQRSNRQPPRPRSCDLEWGDAFAVSPTGRGHLICHGDTVADPSNPVLGYGRVWRAYGFTCVSQTSGVTCRNRSGGGFNLSRGSQTTF